MSEPERVARPDIVARYMRLSQEAADLPPIGEPLTPPEPVYGRPAFTPRPRPTKHERGLYFVKRGRCYWCHRDLTDPVSVARGVGPDCLGKFGPIPASDPEQLETPEQ